MTGQNQGLEALLADIKAEMAGVRRGYADTRGELLFRCLDVLTAHTEGEPEISTGCRTSMSRPLFRMRACASDLCGRLRATRSTNPKGLPTIPTTTYLRNPDGPESASFIEAQAAEIERLRALLVEADTACAWAEKALERYDNALGLGVDEAALIAWQKCGDFMRSYAALSPEAPK